MRAALLMLVFAILFSCKSKSTPDNKGLLQELNAGLTDAIIHDGISPPVASRVYAYTNLAAYEAIQHSSDDYVSFGGKLNGLATLPEGPNVKNYSPEVAAIVAFTTVAKDLVFRDHLMDSLAMITLLRYENSLSEKVMTTSKKYGDALAKEIRKWIVQDNYKETRNMPRFSPTKQWGKWEVTPPTFGEAVEPHWMKIRTLVLDSLYQVADPIPFDTLPGSAFYESTKAVKDATDEATEDERDYALFWDCNPQKTTTKGHFMYVTRQLTPGGHWIGITSIVCKQSNLSLVETAYAHAMVSISIMDAFINCWQEKYRTDLIRPLTYINRYMDANWDPFLETPLFPEHPSGHSTISGAAATILTDLFGDNYAYIDSAELPFGLAPRSFTSFNQAAEEAMMSRFVGGIHYMPACTEGMELGKKVALKALKKANVKVDQGLLGK